MTFADSVDRSCPMSWILPFRIAMSAWNAATPVPSPTVPPVMTRSYDSASPFYVLVYFTFGIGTRLEEAEDFIEFFATDIWDFDTI